MQVYRYTCSHGFRNVKMSVVFQLFQDFLNQYVIAYPEVLKEVERKKAEERALLPARSERLKDRYKSKYKAKTRYDNITKVNCTRSVCLLNILQHDKCQAAAKKRQTRANVSRAPFSLCVVL